MRSLDSGLSTASRQINISGLRYFSSLPPSRKKHLRMIGDGNINIPRAVSVSKFKIRPNLDLGCETYISMQLGHLHPSVRFGSRCL